MKDKELKLLTVRIGQHWKVSPERLQNSLLSRFQESVDKSFWKLAGTHGWISWPLGMSFLGRSF